MGRVDRVVAVGVPCHRHAPANHPIPVLVRVVEQPLTGGSLEVAEAVRTAVTLALQFGQQNHRIRLGHFLHRIARIVGHAASRVSHVDAALDLQQVLHGERWF